MARPGLRIFYNSSVKLLAEGSPVLDGIDLLTKAGIDMMVCGTCVNYYELADKIKPELISDMRSIIFTLMNSDNVITI